MIEHTGVAVGDLARSPPFDSAAVAPLGLRPLMASCGDLGLGELGVRIGAGGGPVRPVRGALPAKDRASIGAADRGALAARGRDHGATGLRPPSRPAGCGALVLDPGRHYIEGAGHGPG